MKLWLPESHLFNVICLCPNAEASKAPCNDSGRKTDLLVLKSHVTSGKDEETWWETTFEMLECRGCHFISLKRTFQFSEYDESETEYFPPPISRRKPSWLGDSVGEIDFLDYDVKQRLLVVVEAKMTMPGLEARYWRDDIHEFVTGSGSYAERFRRKNRLGQ